MKQGQFFNHPSRPEWGTGEVIDIHGSRVVMRFEHAGYKTLDTTNVALERVEKAEPSDLKRLEDLCRRFYSKMEHNRTGVNDGGMALRVLADVRRYGRPTSTTLTRLLNWCHTEGSVFQSGVPLAREICIAIYGRVLPDPDLSR